MKGRYIFVGVTVYLLELIIILVAQHLGASDIVAVGLSFWIGLVISFILQKFFTFNDNRTHFKLVLSQVAAVAALVLFNFGFTLLCTHYLSNRLPVFVIRAGAIGVTTIWNFYLYKSKIFNRQEIILID